MLNSTIPGIYVQEQQYNLNSLNINTRCVTGFVGISEKGNINEPLLIHSFDEYLKSFGGFDTAGFLPYSVYTYFKNGGKECVVVRIVDSDNVESSIYQIKSKNGYIKLKAKSPGKWGNYIIINVWNETNEYFSISLEYKNKLETFNHLSFQENNERYFKTFINKNSNLCFVDEIKGDINNIKSVFNGVFSQGKEGISTLTAKDFIGFYNGLNKYSGLGCLESRDDISLVCIPDLHWLNNDDDVFNVYQALINQIEKFPDRFAIIDIPPKLDFIEAKNWISRIRTPFAAAYYSYIDVTDPLDFSGVGTIRIPPSGAICGCIAATDGEKGIYHAPANCILEGAVGISNKTTTGEQEILYTSNINLLKYFPGKGVKIWGAKTLSCDKDWEYINVRRTFSRVCSALKKGTQWAVYETNDKNLRKRLVRQVSGFLLDLWRDGYFSGSTPEQGFYVRCDEELNPPENIDLGILTFEVGIAIVYPTEFFKITLTAEKDGASVYLQE